MGVEKSLDIANELIELADELLGRSATDIIFTCSLKHDTEYNAIEQSLHVIFFGFI